MPKNWWFIALISHSLKDAGNVTFPIHPRDDFVIELNAQSWDNTSMTQAHKLSSVQDKASAGGSYLPQCRRHLLFFLQKPPFCYISSVARKYRMSNPGNL